VEAAALVGRARKASAPEAGSYLAHLLDCIGGRLEVLDALLMPSAAELIAAWAPNDDQATDVAVEVVFERQARIRSLCAGGVSAMSAEQTPMTPLDSGATPAEQAGSVGSVGSVEVGETSVAPTPRDTWVGSVGSVRREPTPTQVSAGAEEGRGVWTEPEHSWLPVRLVGAPPVDPPAYSSVLYPGRRHLVTGRSDSGKSMLVHVWQAEQIRLRRHVLHFDFEQGRAETLQRLRALGLSDEEIDERFVYFEPQEPVEERMPEVLALVEKLEPAIVAFDSFGSLADLNGKNDNARGEVEWVFRTILTPIAKLGPAVVYLDHLPKDPNADPQHAIGSERKLGLSDVHLRVENVRPLARGRTGALKIEAKRSTEAGHECSSSIRSALRPEDDVGVAGSRVIGERVFADSGDLAAVVDRLG
jgi:hypothetical protein